MERVILADTTTDDVYTSVLVQAQEAGVVHAEQHHWSVSRQGPASVSRRAGMSWSTFSLVSFQPPIVIL